MNYTKLNEWEGTAEERRTCIDFLARRIHEESYPELPRRRFNQLFMEAFTRNVVQFELKEMMAYIADEE